GDVLVTIGSVVSRMEDDEQDQAGNISTATAALFTGHGDIQFTLTWDSICDLDLWVTDPTGFQIIYYDPVSPSGGELDYDNTYGYGPENIYWPEGVAPAGEYLVQVHYFSGDGVSNYNVLITTDGGTQSFSGSITYDEVHTIATVTLEGNKIQSVIPHNLVETKQGAKIPK
ncbi:MAG: YfaP family protein, partial [Bacteroidota bacterium]